jgi:hypothetical protein
LPPKLFLCNVQRLEEWDCWLAGSAVANEEGSGWCTFVSEEAFALDEPRDAEGEDRDGFEPKKSGMPLKRIAAPFPSGQEAEGNTYDDGPSEEVVKIVSLAFLRGAEVFGRSLCGNWQMQKKARGKNREDAKTT